jgi:hypothetical protein
MPLPGIPPVPLYPHAQNVRMEVGEDEGSQASMTTFRTSDSKEDVRRFYQQNLDSESWKMEQAHSDELFSYIYVSEYQSVTSLKATVVPSTNGSIFVLLRIDAWNSQ